MAATLTDELTRVSVADIEKWDEADGTVYVYGRCTTPEVDTDDQVVDSGWSGPALKEYLATAPTVRVQHNPQRDPAGSAVRVDVNRDGDGAHWLKAAVDEPVAQRLVKKGHLRAFSVGIARPVIERDVSGKARGGVIKGGKIVEVSLVDSPANRSCFLEIAKSAADGTCEFTGKVGGDEDVIQKALGADLTKDGGADTWTGTSANMSGFRMPADLDITFTPADMARLMQAKVVEKHYAGLAAKAAGPDTTKRDFDRGVGGGVDRDKLPDSDFAGPHRSFPIVTQSDVSDALGLAGHADDPDAVRARIHAIARRKGLSVPGEGGDSTSKGTVTDTAEKISSEDAAVAAGAENRRQQAEYFPEVAKEAEPEVIKDPEPEDKPRPVKKAKKPPKGKKKLPPWLNKPSDDDGKGDSDDGSCKSVADHLWTGTEGTSEIVCSKCHTTPAEAAGLSGTHDMTCAPVPELLESPPMASTKGGPTPASASGATGESMTPVPRHREPDGALNDPMEADMGASDGDAEKPTRLEAGMMKSSPEVAAILRFRHAGIDTELGRVHDLTCPAYHPEDVAKCHPFADLSRIDADAFQREAVKAACGPDMERANSLNLAWQAAHVLKTANPAELNDYRLAAHKAFRDANPGPNSAPTPGMIVPGRYNRPLITDGHEASSPAHDGPNSSPQVATNAPDAHSFDRPPLSAGHQSPSPSFMKASFEYPQQTGQPMRLDYAVMEKERARHALMQMHEHLSRQFPEVCPMSLDAPPVQPESRGVPPTAGIGKGGEAAVLKSEAPALGAHLTDVTVTATPNALPVAAILKAPAEGDFVDDAVYKGFKKQRKKLGKKVLSGSMTVDEARAKLGRQFAQKGSSEDEAVAATYVTADPGMTPTAIKALQDSLNRLAGDPEHHMKVIVLPPGTRTAEPSAAKALDADLIKAAVREALHVETVPLEAATIEAFDPSPAIEAAVTKAVTPLLEKIQAQDIQIAETQRVIDAIADQPDPSTAAFSGLAFNPLRTTKSRRPAGVVDQADIAERTQQMVVRTLQDKYNSSSDPHEREAYYTTLSKMRGYSEP